MEKRMIWAQLAAVLVLGAICLVAPGFALVSRFRWGPLEKLCGSIGASLVLLYVAALGLYMFNVPRAWHWGISGICVVLAAVNWRSLWQMLSARVVRGALAGFGVLLVWTVLLLGIARHYSGGGWTGDWIEHFQRSLFWLNHLPTDTVIGFIYRLPARPPMMNLLTCTFMAQAGENFEVFQLASAMLNLLIFFPCLLLARAISRRGGALWPMVVILMACPMVAQNVTYTWTKTLGAFYVLLAAWFYLAAIRKGEMSRMVAAALAISAGVLVHYSVGVFLVILVLHYLLMVWWRRANRWRELAVCACCSMVLLGTWLAWSAANYGWTTASSSAAVTSLASDNAGSAAKSLGNLVDSLIPHPLRGVMRRPDMVGLFHQSNKVGYARDWMFLIYEGSLIFAMGLVGGPMILVLTYASLPTESARDWRDHAQRWFPVLLAVGGALLGIAVVREHDPFGLALMVQPAVLLGLVLLAGRFRTLNKTLRWLVLIGCVLDFTLGTCLHFHVENFSDRNDPRLFSTQNMDGWRLSVAARANWIQKYALTMNDEEIATARSAPETPGMNGRKKQAILDMLEKNQQSIEKDFGGYFGRHQGRLTFVGDHCAPCSTILEGAMVLLFGASLLKVLFLPAVGLSTAKRRGGRPAEES